MSMSLLKNRNPLHIPHKPFSLLSIISRTLASSSSETTQSKSKNKKSLYVLFEEVIGSREKTESDDECNSNDELKKGLKDLELEVRNLKANAKVQKDLNVKTEETKSVKRLGLFSLFGNKRREKEERKAMREKEPSGFNKLSPEMEMFVSHLYNGGYLKKANFLSGDGNDLDFSRFDDGYGRDFVKFAADQYAKDHQELAKWLSGSDLKKVALFGCPSLSRKSVFSAKQLRHYFEIKEDTVCSKCALKDSCNFVDKSLPDGKNKNLNLAVVMRVITLYALELVPPHLDVPDEVKASVHRLLKEIINLSQTNLSQTIAENKNVKSLSSLFINKRREKEEKKVMKEKKPRVFKDLSPEMEMFVSHLYKEGYFKKVNFLPGDRKELDFTRFNDSYSREFIKFAAEQYAEDHQELAKWLSGSDLKKVALFGCPTLVRKTVFSAKQLRHYFEIQEDTVCCKCVLKDSCNFVNKSVWNSQNKNLDLAVVMRVVTSYALESAPLQLAVPDEVKSSVHRLLKEIINLSGTTMA